VLPGETVDLDRSLLRAAPVGASSRDANRSDALDRAVAMHDPALGTVRQVFDQGGRVVSIGYPDGQAARYGYSARGEVTSVRDPAIASLTTPLGDWQLSYEPLGRPVRERDPFGVERRTGHEVRQ
jgi:YD repeat-containing protein